MKLLLGFCAFALLALPSPGQTVGMGAAVGGGSSLNAAGSINALGGMAGVALPRLPSSPATSFRIQIASGSEGSFVPSAFVPYNLAVLEGVSSRDRSLFMNYGQAIAEGLAELAAQPKSVAQAARENRREERARAGLKFIQDQSGRVIRQAD